MMDHGFQPAVVIETSPGNFQVWLNHGQTISDRTFSTQAAKELARRFGGDPSSADWRHFGRLAGFTNQKAERLLQNGQAPRLRQWEGRVYDATEEFFGKLKSLAEKAVAERASRVTARPTANGNPVQSFSEFHRSAHYDGDLHRADVAWALHAASRGFSEQQIRDEILGARDLSKKRTHSAPSRLRGKNREQSAQEHRVDALSARLRYMDGAAPPNSHAPRRDSCRFRSAARSGCSAHLVQSKTRSRIFSEFFPPEPSNPLVSLRNVRFRAA